MFFSFKLKEKHLQSWVVLPKGVLKKADPVIELWYFEPLKTFRVGKILWKLTSKWESLC